MKKAGFSATGFYIRSIKCLCWLMLLAGGRLPAQPAPLVTIEVDNRFFTTDKLQQIYVITPTNELIKYTTQGQELFRFNNNTLGDLAWVDTTDPFNLLLFYPDYQVVITLDRTLSLTSETSLWAFDFVDVQAVGTSNDNQLWLYDEVAFKLKKINRAGEVLAASENLNLLLPRSPQPRRILARDNWVYLNDPELGFLRFDNFGQFDRRIDLPGIRDFQVWENRIIYQRDRQLVLYDLRAFQERTVELPEVAAEAEQLRLQRDRLFLRFADRIEVHRAF